MFEFFTQLLTAFQKATRKQIIGLLTFLAVLGLAFILWERWTANFRLTKLERATAVLEHLSQLPGSDTNTIQRLSNHVVMQVTEILDLPSPSKKHSYLSRVLLGFLS